MLIPISTEDFIRIGAAHSESDVEAEIDRLVPIATKDLAHLTEQEYDADLLAALGKHRTAMIALAGGRSLDVGKRIGVTSTEHSAIREGKRVLRRGENVAHTALAKRTPAAGEPADKTRAIANTTGGQIDALSGRIAFDSAKLRTRLSALVTLLAAPEIAPKTPAATDARGKLIG